MRVFGSGGWKCGPALNENGAMKFLGREKAAVDGKITSCRRCTANIETGLKRHSTKFSDDYSNLPLQGPSLALFCYTAVLFFSPPLLFPLIPHTRPYYSGFRFSHTWGVTCGVKRRLWIVVIRNYRPDLHFRQIGMWGTAHTFIIQLPCTWKTRPTEALTEGAFLRAVRKSGIKAGSTFLYPLRVT